MNDLPQLIEFINDQDILKQHYGMVGIRKIMSVSDEPPIQFIIDTGILPKLIDFVNQNQYSQLQLESAWALTNVASGNSEQCKAIIDKGAIPLFIKLLSSNHKGIAEQAVWAIGNIASDSDVNRNEILRQGGIFGLVSILRFSEDSHLIDHSAWALSNICRGKPIPSFETIKQGIFAIAESVAQGKVKDLSIIADCCWAISFSMSSDPIRIDMLFSVNFHFKAVDLLKYQSYRILTPATRILGFLTTSSNAKIKHIYSVPDFWDCITGLLAHEKKVIRAEACWILSNIATGDDSNIDEILKRDELVGTVLKLFEEDVVQVRREIGYLFVNMATEGNPDKIFSFYRSVNILKLYMICLGDQDPRLIREALFHLYTILKFGQAFSVNNQNPFVWELLNLGISPILNGLQMHDDPQIYEQTVMIIKQFLEVDDTLDI